MNDPRWKTIEEEPAPEGKHIIVTLKWSDDDYEAAELDYGMDKHCGGELWKRVVAWMPMPDPWDPRAEGVIFEIDGREVAKMVDEVLKREEARRKKIRRVRL